MKAMEEAVRKISMDGLLWGAAKLVPLAYGIHKLQISCVVEDDKVSIDVLTEEIEKIEDVRLFLLNYNFVLIFQCSDVHFIHISLTYLFYRHFSIFKNIITIEYYLLRCYEYRFFEFPHLFFTVAYFCE